MDDETLAHWTYSAEDWHEYIDDQWKHGIQGTARSVILFFFLAAGAGVLSGRWLPFLIILALTEWIPVLEYRSAVHSREVLGQVPADSWIRESGIEYTHFVLGPRRIEFEGRRVFKVGLIHGKGGLTYLGIVHKGSRRRSSTIPDWIPVPRGCEGEASQIAKRLKDVLMGPKDAKRTGNE